MNSEYVEKIKRASRSCVKKVGVDEELVRHIKNGNIVNDPKVKDYISCVLKKLGMQKSDGSFEEDLIKSKLPGGLSENEKKKVMDKCASIVGSNVADTAWKAYKCYRESSRLTLAENL